LFQAELRDLEEQPARERDPTGQETKNVSTSGIKP
jgi:hypothetical protein